MIAKLLLQNTIFVVALGALLFATAGTLDWPSAWVFLVTSAIIGPACGLWLAKTDPALLAERVRPTAVGVVVGRGDRAGIRHSLRDSRPHRGARLGRGTV